MSQPGSSFVDAGEVRLHYLEWLTSPVHAESASPFPTDGSDGDTLPVILLHGLGATADTWKLVAKILRQQHTLFAFDLRGHGLSDQPEHGYDLVTVAEDAIGAMAALGLGQVALVGHGWGARIAMTLTARHPALISHLVLVDCPLVEPRHWPGMTRERFLQDREIPAEIYSSRTTYLQSLQEELASFWSPEIEAIFLTHVCELEDGKIEERLRPEHEREIRASLWDDRALDYYGKLSCPVLLVPAAAEPKPDEEPPERLEDASEFAAAKGQIATQVARAIQRCSVLWMPDTSHYIQLQRPQLLADAITNFLQD